MQQHIPSVEAVDEQLTSGSKVLRVLFDTKELGNWDSGLLTFLTKVMACCSEKKIVLDKEGLPQGVQRLLALATAVPERKGARREAKREPFLSSVGVRAIEFYRTTIEMVGFIGEAFLAFIKFLGGQASFRRSDLVLLDRESACPHPGPPPCRGEGRRTISGRQPIDCLAMDNVRVR